VNNLAARAGRWSAVHWKAAVVGWLVFVAVAFALGNAVGTNKLKDADSGSGESAVAERILADAHFDDPAAESVLIHHPASAAADPAFKAVIVDIATKLGKVAGVEQVRSPLDTDSRGLVSKDGHSALVQFDIAGDPDQASGKVAPMLSAVAALGRAHPGYTVEEFGSASVERALSQTLDQDFKRAEYLSLPITLVILLLAFGALTAAGIPLLLAFSAVIGTLGLSALASHLLPATDITASVVLLMGLAVGVDYALFYLRREREETAAGRDSRSALQVAAATSGHAVLISGATVMVAMAGMLLAGDKTFTSIGVGAMLVVAVAVVGSLSVLPAVLAKLGRRVEWGRIPLLARSRRQGGGRIWSAILTPVLRRPLVAALAAGLLLLGLALPVLRLHTALSSFTDLPKGLPIVQTYQRLQASFPGSSVPAIVVIKDADVTSPEVTAAIAALHRQAIATGQMAEPVQVRVSPDRTVAQVQIPLAGSGQDAASHQALATLRGQVVPATVERLPGARVAVTGVTAGTTDFNQQMRQRTPVVFGFVLGLAFLLLLFSFRSIVIPIKAILLNLLSVGASYGILVAVFQFGWGASLIGADATGAIVSWLPLFLFAVLFGLSMDYHVFILSRVKELVDRGEPTTTAVEHGIKATAGTVTSAAIVMVGIFAIFATLRTIDMKQLGFGLAIAILLDATIVRGVLLPATMQLLGDWNWYLPRWLNWLPRLGRGDSSRVELEPAGVDALVEREPVKV
jgi:uncharacterized membrane protein YdfJ with MMPL/SSD domain